MAVTIEGIKYIPAAEAALQLGTTETRVLMLLKQQALDGELIEGNWLVTAASLACYDARAHREAAQPQCRASCSSSGCGRR